MISIDCANSDIVRIMLYAIMFIIIVLLPVIMMIYKLSNAYFDLDVKYKLLKNDVELNNTISHENIQKSLCPHELIDVNNKHLYELDKCKSCKSKQFKSECWKQYFIEKQRRG